MHYICTTGLYILVFLNWVNTIHGHWCMKKFYGVNRVKVLYPYLVYTIILIGVH